MEFLYCKACATQPPLLPMLSAANAHSLKFDCFQEREIRESFFRGVCARGLSSCALFTADSA
jgi:hypothetical protein